MILPKIDSYISRGTHEPDSYATVANLFMGEPLKIVNRKKAKIFTEKEIEEIREKFAQLGFGGKRKLAKEYGASTQSIGRICGKWTAKYERKKK